MIILLLLLRSSVVSVPVGPDGRHHFTVALAGQCGVKRLQPGETPDGARRPCGRGGGGGVTQTQASARGGLPGSVRRRVPVGVQVQGRLQEVAVAVDPVEGVMLAEGAGCGEAGLRLGGGGRHQQVPAVRQPGVGLLEDAVVVVEHGVSAPNLHLHTVAHWDRLQHLHHFLVRHPQHAHVIDVHQNVRCGE